MTTHILLIDDDEDERDIFIEAIEELRTPLTCTFAQGADQAFKLLGTMTPDLIFVDYNMPRTNGIKCLAQLRKIPALQQVPMILYSNFISEENTRMALNLGAFACVKKPSSVSRLARILSDLLISSGKQQNGPVKNKKSE